MVMRIFIIIVSVAFLSACGESSEEAYERGFEDGIETVCGDVYSVSTRMYDTLRSERIC